ncbi:MATE family efflux transporter [Lachnoclostridium sp. Marseille-P6806]|uniref:MATE family efflux transporter n=1 Tax=Lachnoclostridium sp. Marseille-P6806 TaxID=2364793 RepID=UPI0010313081|nr:MATE family efflux transporter [Lachnoclostridium sp. Marseille-P6806]
MKHDYLAEMREGRPLTTTQEMQMILRLSLPAILAQMTSIIMQYIDASMVGHLGADATAAIGLLGPSTWLFGGIVGAVSTGFAVQVAQAVGAGKDGTARGLVRLGLLSSCLIGLLLLAVGASLHLVLPKWLGGAPQILHDASAYFLVFAFTLPVAQLAHIAASMLQASGNMRFPSSVQILMCALDVLFNRLLIYDATAVPFGGSALVLPGAGLGVLGAALGTTLAQAAGMAILLGYLLFFSPKLRLRRGDPKLPKRPYLVRALHLALPVAAEQSVLCTAQIAVIRIIAPLGTVAVAANSLGITTESFCYMPGYGISSAAVTVIGQSVGAGRKDMTRKLGVMAVILGMGFMSVTGVLLYLFAPSLIGILTPVPEIVELGAACLRIEALAEPLFAASIVAAGVFRGAGNTLYPSLINLLSIWLIRIPAAALLSPRIGLTGAWIGMALDVSVRGLLFLLVLAGTQWLARAYPELHPKKIRHPS